MISINIHLQTLQKFHTVKLLTIYFRFDLFHIFLSNVCVVLIQFEGNSLICFVSKALTHSYFGFDSCAAAFKTPSWST